MNEDRHLNKGLYFAKPFESAYSIWRRYVSANRNLRGERIFSELKIERSKRFLSLEVEKFYDAVIRLNYKPGMEPAYLSLTKALTSGRHAYCLDRHCYMCAESGYHTDIFKLKWITNCPIHNCELTQTCPTCKKPWPNFEVLTKRKCQTCGLISLDKLSQSHTVYDQDTAFDDIESLIDFVNFRQHDNTNILGSHDYIAYFHSNTIKYWDKEFPFFQRLIYKKPIDDLLVKVGCSRNKIQSFQALHSKSKLEELESFEYSVLRTRVNINNNNLERMTAEARISTIKKIHQLINKLTAKPHSLTIYDLRLMNNLNLQHAKPCLYCLALSIWYFAISANPLSTQVNYKGDWRSRLFSFINDFRTPLTMDVLIDGNRVYQLDQKVTQLLYERDLMSAYCWLLNILNERMMPSDERSRHNQDFWKYHGTKEQDNPLFFCIDDETLHLITQETDFQFDELPKFRDANTICSRYYRYLCEENILPQIFRDSTTGLTKEQLNHLKNGCEYTPRRSPTQDFSDII